MIGVLSTVILQSSSTSSSIVITMVASNILDIRPAIPIIMGANIGTTVTNTLVSLAHSMNRKEFRRAFSGAVVHDVFNWLTVLILLPLEYCTGYLYYLTKEIIASMNMEAMKAKNQDLLMVITKPLTSRIVEIDKDVITSIAEGKNEFADKPVLKIYCSFNKTTEYTLFNETIFDNSTGTMSWVMVNKTIEKLIPVDKCDSLFSKFGWNDTSSGITIFIFSITALSLCLYAMVKLLHSLLGGHIAKAARKTINADFPRPFHWLTGYAALVVGAGMTILVQSSSVFTSALTPLVGIGCLKLERMYPLTLGSNIGTTFTGILAALASSSATISVALQLALCHLFFNITGILLFYPVPRMRIVVINTAKYLGRTTARYRWFAIAYIILMFLVFPGLFFAASFAGKIVFIITLCILSAISIFIVVINVMQRYPSLRSFLPVGLHTWNFLPEFMRSLAPIDRCLSKLVVPFSKCCCQCCLDRCSCIKQIPDIDMGGIDSDSESESSAQSSYLPSAASSRMFLSSQSGTDLKSSSSRIYKPRESSSRRNSLTRKSPSIKRANLSEAAISTASPLLGESDDRNPHDVLMYISRPDLITVIDGPSSNTVTVDMSGLTVDSLKESVI
uniref:Sodium-dependent phosphate transport protein 2B n=1 Tax=Arion vulgaris TaxID=1028688 RepID=A0A0B7BHU4_9EUPU